MLEMMLNHQLKPINFLVMHCHLVILPPASNKCYIYAKVSENRSFVLLNTIVLFLRINRIFDPYYVVLE